MNPPKRILYTILNWGLGHATRSIPIINALLEQGVELVLASDGVAFHLLEKEFPQLPIVQLPAYNVHYKSDNMMWSIAPQLPKILWAIIQEHRVTKQLVEKHQIDAIISDNRFGCYHSFIPTVFITHQLSLKMPSAFLATIANMGNRFWIKKFQETWVPDVEKQPNISGDLSRLNGLPNVHYIGIHSRMKKQDNENPIYDAIAVLSGPEPQRTFLQEKILAELKTIEGNFLVVCGKTNEQTDEQWTKNIRLISYLTSKDLNQAITESKIVISRSGYTTLLDLARLQKKAILIPTIGQTEQEYLAEKLGAEQIFVVQKQGEVDLKTAFAEIKNTTGFTIDFSNQLLENRIKEWLDGL